VAKLSKNSGSVDLYHGVRKIFFEEKYFSYTVICTKLWTYNLILHSIFTADVSANYVNSPC